eukprot:TRINITY_DN14818_c0_g1_i1.p1 TRINITY_DN14818_c0_g1~~TRINITY_DN14818_c0_g1_i1.p1  ORF type:complete len:178 (-),score=26.89 TRINITY_DN14818_c0_g1_i1:237-770(-)
MLRKVFTAKFPLSNLPRSYRGTRGGHIYYPTNIPKTFFRMTSSTSLPPYEGGVSMVQGASRGIGLEFVRQLLDSDNKSHVIATCRTPNSSVGLQALKREHKDRLTVLPLDATDEESINMAAIYISEHHGRLNLLINASGILSISNVLEPERSLCRVERSSLLLSFEVNAVGPILVIK